MARDCVIFDLRGTLTERSSSYGILGAAAHYEDAATIIVGGAHRCLKTARQLKRSLISTQLIPDSVKNTVWRNISKLDPEAVDTLQTLRDRFYATALLSNDPRPLGERAIHYNGIRDLFDAVRFAKSRDEAKPNPVGLQAIMSRLSVRDGDVFMVGDRASDMFVAFNAARITGRNVIPIACARDTEAAQFLASLNTHAGYILDKGLGQLPDLISEIRR